MAKQARATRFVERALSLALALATFGCESKTDTLKQAATSTLTVTLTTPRSVPPRTVALGASNSISVGPSSKILDPSGRPAIMTNIGAQAIQLGSSALVGDVWSASHVGLGSSVHALGRVHAASVTVGSGAVVDGGIDRTPVLTPSEKLSWNVTFTETLKNFALASGKSGSTGPGRYGTLSAASGATLTLTSGSYFIDTLKLDLNSKLVLQQSGGPVLLYVKNSVSFHAPVKTTTGVAPDLLVAYLGTTAVVLDVPFNGTFIAPRVMVQLTSVSAPYVGAFFANDLQLGSAVAVNFRSPTAVLPNGMVVAPVAECVIENGPNDYVAVFGYRNLTNASVVRTAGPLNRLDPPVAGAKLPTTFEPGARSEVFSVPFNGTPFTWQLDGGSTTANIYLPRCVASCVAHLSNPTLPPAKGVQPVRAKALSVDESHDIRDAFDWEQTAPVAEFAADGLPIMYYGQVLLSGPESKEMLDAFQIHYDAMPLFEEERRPAIAANDGHPFYQFDGQGQFVFALVPGKVYNAIRAAALDPKQPVELFRAFTLRPLPAADAVKTCDLAPVAPCLGKNATGADVAVFGYQNPSGPVTVPNGPRNTQTGSAKQPELFAAGSHAAVFTVPFTGAPVSWTLNGQTVTASSTSPACAAGTAVSLEAPYQPLVNNTRRDLQHCRRTTPAEAEFPMSSLPPAARVDTCQSLSYDFAGKVGLKWRGLDPGQVDTATEAAWKHFGVDPTTFMAPATTSSDDDVYVVRQAFLGKLLRVVVTAVAEVGKAVVDGVRQGLTQAARLFVGSDLITVKLDILNTDGLIVESTAGDPNVITRAWGKEQGKEMSIGGATVRAPSGLLLDKSTANNDNTVSLRVIKGSQAEVCVETRTAAVDLVSSWFLPAWACSHVTISEFTPPNNRIPFDDGYLNVLAQLSDGAAYMDQAMDFSMHQSRALVGWVADLAGSRNGTRAFTPCFAFSWANDFAIWAAHLAMFKAEQLAEAHILDATNSAASATRASVEALARTINVAVGAAGDALVAATDAAFKAQAQVLIGQIDALKTAREALAQAAIDTADASHAAFAATQAVARVVGQNSPRESTLRTMADQSLADLKAAAEVLKQAANDVDVKAKAAIASASTLAAKATTDAEKAAAAAVQATVSAVGQGVGIILEKAIIIVGNAVNMALKGVASIVGFALGEVVGLIVDLFGNTDIVLPVSDTDRSSIRSREVPAHEYGHFVLCNLLERSNPSVFSHAYNEAAAVLADQTADKEHAIINEGFADFITGQLAGAISYSQHLPGLQGKFNVRTAAAGGLESNADFNTLTFTDVRSMFQEKVGLMASLLHDLFDGIDGTGFNDTPSNAHPWNPEAMGQFSMLGTVPNEDDDVLCPIMADGQCGDRIQLRNDDLFRSIRSAFTIGDRLRFPKWFKGFGRSAVESRNWCSACDLFRLHGLSNCADFLPARPTGLVCSFEPCPPPKVVHKNAQVCADPCPAGQSLDARTLRCVAPIP